MLNHFIYLWVTKWCVCFFFMGCQKRQIFNYLKWVKCINFIANGMYFINCDICINIPKSRFRRHFNGPFSIKPINYVVDAFIIGIRKIIRVSWNGNGKILKRVNINSSWHTNKLLNRRKRIKFTKPLSSLVYKNWKSNKIINKNKNFWFQNKIKGSKWISPQKKTLVTKIKP